MLTQVLLTIDTGNTQTVVGMYRAGELVHHWRFATNAERTADEHALLLSQFLNLHGHALADVEGIAISSTVPTLTATLRRMTNRYFAFDPVVVGPGVKTGMPILYDNPREVGPDRIANAVAAYDLYGGPCIVVDFGTATTFDAISAKGEYLGGAIVPGIEISMNALFSRAAALRRIELIEPRNAIGRNTEESIQSGAIYGYAAQVDGLCERFERELGECTVVSTGGLATVITPYAPSIDEHEPWLTLHGLRLIHERNCETR